MMDLKRAILILKNLLEILIVVRMFMSFIPFTRPNIFTTIVYELTEPIIGPIRELIAKLKINTGMFDFSPLLAIFLIRYVLNLIIRII